MRHMFLLMESSAPSCQPAGTATGVSSLDHAAHSQNMTVPATSYCMRDFA